MASSSNPTSLDSPSDAARFLVEWAVPHAHEFGRVIDQFVVRRPGGGFELPQGREATLNQAISEAYARLAAAGPFTDAFAIIMAATAIADSPADKAFLTEQLAILAAGESFTAAATLAITDVGGTA